MGGCCIFTSGFVGLGESHSEGKLRVFKPYTSLLEGAMTTPWVILFRYLAADAVGGEPLNRLNRVNKKQRCVSDGLKRIAMRFQLQVTRGLWDKAPVRGGLFCDVVCAASEFSIIGSIFQ